MNLKSLTLCVALIATISCSKTENEEGINGKWFLVNASGGIAGISQNFPKGDILWTFDDEKLKVVNDYTGQWNVSLPSNEYTIDIENTIEGQVLNLSDQYFANIRIANDSLILSQDQFADGFGFIFIR